MMLFNCHRKDREIPDPSVFQEVICLSLDQKRRLYRVLWWTGGAVLALVGYALFVNFFGFGLPCMYKQLFHIDCAGCGLSRAAAALIRLDFKAAFRYNAVWPLYLVYGLWAVPASVIPYVREGKQMTFPKPKWINFAVLGVILAYGVVRNFI